MRRTVILVLAFIACVTVFVMCMDDRSNKTPLPPTAPEQPFMSKYTDYSEFAGSLACQKCHADIYKSHSGTNHFKTSRPATEKNIRGSFKDQENTFYYNPELYIEMQKRDTALYQVVMYQGKEVLAIPFSLTLGSGNKGQSYAHWQGSRLFQMPLTYYSVAERWANSPGFPSKVQYDRPITARCMECHTTYNKIISPAGKEPEEFDRTKIIYGVDCEKCHGPGKRHVDFHSQNADTTPAFIVNPARLSRQRNLELCALCHGGQLEKKQPSFTYTVGDSLSQFFKTEGLNKTGRDYISVDVHGNQYGLLSASKCFIKTDMTCNTCHDPHKNERNRLAMFSAKCQSCHSGDHKINDQLKAVPANVLKSNCIDCHMPSEESHLIVLSTSGMEKPKAVTFRSHFIAVYSKESNKFIENLKATHTR